MVSRTETEGSHPQLQKISGDFEGKSILSSEQFNQTSLVKLFETADHMRDIDMRRRDSRILAGSIVGFCFTESKSFDSEMMTRLPLNAAVVRLGGLVINVDNSSIPEGERLEDTIDILRTNCNLVVLGNQKVKLVQETTCGQSCPLINVGDGLLQKLSDLYAASKNSGRSEPVSLEDQASNNMYVGMALLTLVLGKIK